MRLHDSLRFDAIQESLGNEANKNIQVKRDIKRPRLVEGFSDGNKDLQGLFKLAIEHDKLLYIYIPADGRSGDTIMSLVRHGLKNIHI